MNVRMSNIGISINQKLKIKMENDKLKCQNEFCGDV